MAPGVAASMWKVHSALVVVQFLYAGGLTLSKVTFSSGVHPIAFSVYRDFLTVAALAPVAYFAERYGYAGASGCGLCTSFFLVAVLGRTLTYVVSGWCFVGRFVGYFHRRQRPPLDKATLAQAWLLGFTGEFAGGLLYVYGIDMAPASFGPLVPVMIPIFAFIISTAFGVEVIEWRRRTGQAKVGGVISACFGGLLMPLYRGPVMISSRASSTLGAHSAILVPDLQVDIQGVMGIKLWQLGAICLILAALTNAIQLNIQAQLLKTYPAILSLAASTYCVGGTMLAGVGFLTIQNPSSWVVIHTASDVIAVAYTGLLASGAVFYLQSWAISKSGPMLTACHAPLTSVVTTSIAYFLMGESIHLGSVLGMLLILNGLLLITWGQIKTGTTEGEQSPAHHDPLLGKDSKGQSSLKQRLLA